jgi:hypothetical protein
VIGATGVAEVEWAAKRAGLWLGREVLRLGCALGTMAGAEGTACAGVGIRGGRVGGVVASSLRICGSG